MIEYNNILIFKYKGKIYNYYLDDKNRKFFTCINSNSDEEYIDIKEYIELLCLFSKKNEVMSIDSNDKFLFDNNNEYNTSNKKQRKKKIIPKVIIGGSLAVITPIVLSSAISVYSSSHSFKEAYYNNLSNSSTISSEYNNYYTDGGVPDKLDVDTYIDNRDISKKLYVYDMDYVDMAIDFPKKDLDDFINVINNNSKISEKFKPIIIEYCRRLFEKYPNVELRPFYRNLQNLEIVECSEQELLNVSIDINSCGCYVKSEDKIYVIKGKDYKDGTWDYQIIYHELSHCLRDSQFTDKDGNDVSIQFTGLNYWDVPNSEAINSLFAVSLLDYDERNIAYQFQSNTHKILIECMDNYSLDDYVNHSLTYYAKKLDEYNDDDNYALTIFSLMNAQYEDYHNDSIEAPQSEYYPIYDYVSKIYFKKYINSNMTYDEAKQVYDGFLDKLLFDVPKEYNVDENHIYNYFNNYCSQIGINTNQIVK